MNAAMNINKNFLMALAGFEIKSNFDHELAYAGINKATVKGFMENRNIKSNSEAYHVVQ